MIESKELGAKVAENPEEAFWTGVKTEADKRILSCEREIVINKHILLLCSDKLKPYSKD